MKSSIIPNDNNILFPYIVCFQHTAIHQTHVRLDTPKLTVALKILKIPQISADNIRYNRFQNFTNSSFSKQISISRIFYFTNFYLFLGWTKMHLRHGTYVWLPRRKFTSRRRRYWGRSKYQIPILLNFFLARNFKFKFFFSQNILARIPGISVPTGGDENPYMEGQKLPVAAKKGMFWINNNSISTWWEILKQTYSDIHRILLKTIKNIKNFQNRQRNLSFLKSLYTTSKNQVTSTYNYNYILLLRIYSSSI